MGEPQFVLNPSEELAIHGDMAKGPCTDELERFMIRVVQA